LNAISKVPYGIRWICQQIQNNSQKKLSSTIDEIMKVLGYFVYYRFHNIAIVTPDTFGLIDKELSMNARRNLVVVSKVLQNLFTLNKFSESGGEKYFTPMNEWISRNTDDVKQYFEDLVDVSDPADFLRVDKYNELTLKVKPVVVVTVDEIMQTHKHIEKHKDKIIAYVQAKRQGKEAKEEEKGSKDKKKKSEKPAKASDDPLQLILSALPEPFAEVPEEDNREIQLTLASKFATEANEDEVDASAGLYSESKELVISVLKAIPDELVSAENDLEKLLEEAKKWAKDNKKKAVLDNCTKIEANVKKLEQSGVLSGGDKYVAFLRGVALEVVNRQEIREQQRKEIKRLTIALRNLRKHETYMKDKIDEYNNYLKDVLLHYGPAKKKKKASKPVKFSYKKLESKGVIVDSEVPKISRRQTNFFIATESPGVFTVKAKIGALQVETIPLYLDDLLEKHQSHIERLELEQVTLDVNMTLHLINELFLK